MELTTIQLTDLEAKSFITFQKHRSVIEMLENAGFFKLQNGSIEIHKDAEGRIRAIDVHVHTRI